MEVTLTFSQPLDPDQKLILHSLQDGLFLPIYPTNVDAEPSIPPALVYAIAGNRLVIRGVHGHLPDGLFVLRVPQSLRSARQKTLGSDTDIWLSTQMPSAVQLLAGNPVPVPLSFQSNDQVGYVLEGSASRLIRSRGRGSTHFSRETASMWSGRPVRGRRWSWPCQGREPGHRFGPAPWRRP